MSLSISIQHRRVTDRHATTAIAALTHSVARLTRNSAVADKPHDAFVQMQWRGWPKQHY